MSISSDKEIKVYNYCTSPICLQGQSREYFIEGSTDGVPAVEHITLRELEYINSRTHVIRTGAVEFDEDVREEVYSALHIPNWKETTFFESDIDSMIRNWTADNAQRIISIPDAFTFERIRGHFVGLMNDPSESISNRMIDLIEKRTIELRNGKTKSAYVVERGVDEPKEESSNDKVKAMEEQLEQMKQLLQQVMSTQNAATQNVEDAVKSSSNAVVKSNRGRKRTSEK